MSLLGRQLSTGLVAVCCGLIVGVGTAQAADPMPRTALLDAQAALRGVASPAGSGSSAGAIGAAIKSLAKATDASLWINAREADAPSYGTNVFTDSIVALSDLQAAPGTGVRAASRMIVAADRSLAVRVIGEAAGGPRALLAAARRYLATATHDAAAGQIVPAARFYAKAWKAAFAALTKLVVAELTSFSSTNLIAAAENSLGSRRIGLSGPLILKGQPKLMLDGKPELLFIGSEGCPFCGVERWGMIVALSQFGAFSNLHLMQSTVSEKPHNRTLTFFRSSYSSPYIAFVPVEAISNVPIKPTKNIPRGFRFAHLQKLTPAQRALFNKFDNAEETPFIDLDGQFITVQSTVLPQLIAKLSWTRLASALTHPGSIPAQAIAGEAEVLTAEICEATGGAPQSVCSASVVTQYEQALPLLNGQGGGCPTTSTAGDSLRARGWGAAARAQPVRARPAKCAGR